MEARDQKPPFGAAIISSTELSPVSMHRFSGNGPSGFGAGSAVAGGVASGLLGRAQVVDGVEEYAVLDQFDALSGYALEVERCAEGPRVDGVVHDRHASAATRSPSLPLKHDRPSR